MIALSPNPPSPAPTRPSTRDLLRVLDPSRADTTTAVCPYCGVGCVLRAEVDEQKIQRVKADRDVRPNLGMMCPKGALVGRTLDGKRRLLRPMIRETRGGPLRPVSWEQAISRIAERLAAARETHGPGAMAWYGSGQLDTESS